MTGTTISQKNQNISEIIKSYYQLTKPRIIPLLLITTAASMWIASKGKVEPLLLINTLIGGTLAAASAQTFNCIYDKDIDYDMERTRSRPLPSGKISTLHAFIFALILGSLSFTILTIFVNIQSAILALSGIGFYMVIYTHFLKRHTTQNIVMAVRRDPFLPLWAGRR
jgi:heme o synthase